MNLLGPREGVDSERVAGRGLEGGTMRWWRYCSVTAGKLFNMMVVFRNGSRCLVCFKRRNHAFASPCAFYADREIFLPRLQRGLAFRRAHLCGLGLLDMVLQ
jgi:hypothetical protein